jgi:phenylpropionate dioxygenase-like ring-hydroxylating dioxygenase large terminal subunit
LNVAEDDICSPNPQAQEKPMAIDQATLRWGDLVQPNRVHRSLYTDPAVFQRELQLIWNRTWVYIGHESETPGPGDFVSRPMGEQRVLMVRGDDGELRLLVNRCTHRGNLVCQDESGTARSFRCNYHGWTFAPDGQLRSAPFPEGFGPEFDEKDFALVPVPRMAGYRGFVFGSMSPTGETLEDHLGNATTYMDHFLDFSPTGEVELRAGVIKHRFDANWKLGVENTMDNYHPAFLHRSCIAEFSAEGMIHSEALSDKGPVVTRDLGGGHAMLDFSGQNRISGSPMDFSKGKKDAAAFAEYRTLLENAHGKERADKLLGDGLSITVIFPNLALVFGEVRIFQPVKVTTTDELHFAALLPGVPDAVNDYRVRAEVSSYGGAGYLGADDADLYERIQLGLESEAVEWLELRRGAHREEHDDDSGTIVGRASDENSQRGFWRHYNKLMTS